MLAIINSMLVMQNALNSTFGQSGDNANVPPIAAAIGPFSSWQRMTSRLATHDPVAPLVSGSMLQTKKTKIYISEELAAPFECWEKVGY